MGTFSILDGKICLDPDFNRGSVWFRCSDYGLPDNTGTSYHSVYRPLCRGQGYKGEEVVTDAMMADTRALYAAHDAAEKAAADAIRERENAAHDALMGAIARIPAAAKDELRTLNAQYARLARAPTKVDTGMSTRSSGST